MSAITKIGSTDVIDPQAQRIIEFLQQIGLPADNIIADNSQRAIIGNNLATLMDSIPEDVRRDARYLSKFVVGAAVGLFDYSLNSIWNEVVLNLRKKAVLYGIDIFFDAAVGGSKNRDFYKSEDDLTALKDSILLDTCRKLELISDTTYKKLHHILDMRNDIGISHPTTYSINAFELLGWLQTCVNDVLNDRPTEAALQVQAFISNLKDRTTPIDGATLKSISAGVSALPSHLCGNLLRTVFGIYVSPTTDPAVRKNISEIAPLIWQNCIDEPKYKLGILLEGYKSNLHQDKYNLGQQFFSVVGGNSYRSASERNIIIDDLLDTLWSKHNGWDNFAYKAPVAASLASYIISQADIIANISAKLFKTVLACRVGRGVSYCDGVSPRGKDYYDHMLGLAGDQYAGVVIASLGHYELQSKFSKSICRSQAKLSLEIVKSNVINQRLKECLDYLITNIESDAKCIFRADFKKLSQQYVNCN